VAPAGPDALCSSLAGIPTLANDSARWVQAKTFQAPPSKHPESVSLAGQHSIGTGVVSLKFFMSLAVMLLAKPDNIKALLVVFVVSVRFCIAADHAWHSHKQAFSNGRFDSQMRSEPLRVSVSPIALDDFLTGTFDVAFCKIGKTNQACCRPCFPAARPRAKATVAHGYVRFTRQKRGAAMRAICRHEFSTTSHECKSPLSFSAARMEPAPLSGKTLKHKGPQVCQRAPSDDNASVTHGACQCQAVTHQPTHRQCKPLARILRGVSWSP